MEISEFELAVHLAIATGYKVETYEIMPGVIGYQLRHPDGEYIQFAGNEEALWQHAFDRGLLPPVLEDDQ